MNKPKFSLAKAKKAVLISSKIEGHKVKHGLNVNRKKVKSKANG